MNLVIKSLLIFVLLLSTSCGKDNECLPSGLAIAFTNYDTTFSDTVILKAYIKENNFNSLFSVDTLYLKDTLNQKYSTSIINDTAYINYMIMKGNDSEMDGYLNQNYDWKIITKNNTYNLTDFKYTPLTSRCGIFECPPCFVPITHFKLNNTIIVPKERGLFFVDY